MEAPPASAGGIDAAAIRNVWPQLLTSLRKFAGGRSLEAMLTQATVVGVEGSAVTLTHKSEPLARRLGDQDNTRKIAGALTDVLGGEWQVRCVHGAVPAAAAPRAATPAQPAATAPERSFTRRSAAAPAVDAPAAAPVERPAVERPPAAEPTRPTPAPEPPPRPKVATSEPDIPLPPEPSDEDDDDIYSEDASPAPPPPPIPADQDPDEIARKLLSDHLGARPLD